MSSKSDLFRDIRDASCCHPGESFDTAKARLRNEGEGELHSLLTHPEDIEDLPDVIALENPTRYLLLLVTNELDQELQARADLQAVL